MERVENQSWQRAKEATVGMYCMPEEKDSMLGREARLQTLSSISNTVCL
jgi:hypothetical protein